MESLEERAYDRDNTSREESPYDLLLFRDRQQQYVAERVAGATDDHLIFLRDAIRSRCYHFDVSLEKRIGFVVPAYCCGLPSILNFFVDKLRLSGYEDQYVYLVLTCGSATATRRASWGSCWEEGDRPQRPVCRAHGG